ncbi:ribonucleotide reductase inhibitor-domain-containing protein [Biscogniauxia marginata]|nr:ribonucleotide reductase inhibitor-domain-containing protein [Biscogniauxia marginata]
MMSTSRAKRQFAGASKDPAQRQITSFFTANDGSTSTINQRPSDSSPLSTPSLPTSVQSNLLSVGMRVRKSVPEGYKTGSYSAFSLWDERNDSTGSVENSRSRANAVSSPRELLPFCGIHKVDGLDTQPEHPQYATSNNPSNYQQPSLSINGTPLDDGMNDVPCLTSSQDSVESMDSTLSTYTNASTRTRKRFFTEDEDDTSSTEMLGRHLSVNTASYNAALRGADLDGEISPRSHVPVGWGDKSRVMAVPKKGRLRGKLTGLGTTSQSEGQENVMVIDSSGDFEEADFLADRRTWEREVDMSDI